MNNINISDKFCLAKLRIDKQACFCNHHQSSKANSYF